MVEARREDWSVEPFELTERGGYFCGRGTMDIKDEAAGLIANLERILVQSFYEGVEFMYRLMKDLGGQPERDAL